MLRHLRKLVMSIKLHRTVHTQSRLIDALATVSIRAQLITSRKAFNMFFLPMKCFKGPHVWISWHITSDKHWKSGASNTNCTLCALLKYLGAFLYLVYL